MNKTRCLDDIRYLRRFDRSNMLELLESFPGQCRSAKALGEMAIMPAPLKKFPFKNIVCTGLGGSAIGADIARSYLAGIIDLPIIVNRDYLLPAFVGPETLLVVSSYSGNTEETVSAYKDGRKKKVKAVAITSGGEIKKLACFYGDPIVMMPGGFPPRAALGYSFFSLLAVLSKLGITGNLSSGIDMAIASLEKMRSSHIGFSVKSGRNIAKRLAADLAGRLPVVYSAQAHFDAVATRWKGQLAENAKVISLANVFPEMNHNEIMGWENPREVLEKAVAVLLRDGLDHPRVARRMDITKKILIKEGFEVLEVRSHGADLLERIFSLIYIGDFVSYYLAILNREDPTSISRINYLKKELSGV